VGVDIVHPDHDLSGYRLVIVPTLYSVDDGVPTRLADAVDEGATVLVTYFSGITDENDHIRLGGYPGAFRELLGVRVEEFCPLRAGERVRLTDGSTADVWTEHLHLAGATSMAEYADGPLPGVPAITRHEHGKGVAWYVATRLEQAALDKLVHRLVEEAGVRPVAATRPGVEVIRRVAADGRRWAFVVNHTDEDADLDLAGHDLVSDRPTQGPLRVRSGGVAVIRQEHPC
ncbi:beta-galactosidase trimerization domain-containing protein, partial [Nocardioides sp.]|uniref:beta-galactosidase n=1 Tax=Nocardioides sp. TaxID=35761 RepID=UPI0031FF1C46|nr:beta-galactosidase [Nocardioides sp.]